MTGWFRMPHPPLTCRDVIATLDDYVARKMSATDRTAVEAHLSSCNDCANYLKSYASTIRMAKSVFPKGGEGEMPEDLLESILRSRRRH